MASKSHPAICQPLFPIGMIVQAYDADWPGTVTEIMAPRSADPWYRIAFSDYISSWVRQSSITRIPAQSHGGDDHAACDIQMCPPALPTPAIACIHQAIAGHPPMASCAMGL